MKAVNKLGIFIALGVLLPFAASAKTRDEAYLEKAIKRPGLPVPVAVVSPIVSNSYAGAQVELAFTVDTNGTPTGFTIVSAPDELIARAIMQAVGKWRFTPAQKDGAAVATRVVLPVEIADGRGADSN